MNAKTSRWIAVGILAVLAIVSVLLNPGFGEESIVTTALLVGLFMLIIMVSENNSVVASAPVILFGWLHFGSQILYDGYAPSVETIIESIELILNYMANEDLILVSGVIAFVLHLCLRAVDKKIVIILRYAVMGWFLYNVAPTDLIFQLFALVALVNMCYELTISGIYNSPHRRMGNTYLVCGIFLLLCGAYGERLPRLYMNTFIDHGAFSIYAIIAVGILGGLIVMEKMSRQETKTMYLHFFKEVGATLLFWCGTALVTLLFRDLSSIDVLVLAPLVLYQLYKFFVKKWRESNANSSESTVFYITWTLISVLILALSKSVAIENLFIMIFLVAAPVISVIVWYIASTGQNDKEVMVKYMGVISVIALAVTMDINTSKTVELATFILSVALLCVFWCLMCGRIYRLNRTASTVDKEEFLPLAKLQKYAPLIVITVALIKILISDGR